jgi:hypothetical protein
MSVYFRFVRLVVGTLDRPPAPGYGICLVQATSYWEDVARLSPLGHEHINMLGRYAFSLPDRIARGGLRPLRNPALALEDA